MWGSNQRSSRLCCEMFQHLLKIKCHSIYYFLHLIVIKFEASLFETILYIMTLLPTEGNKSEVIMRNVEHIISVCVFVCKT